MSVYQRLRVWHTSCYMLYGIENKKKQSTGDKTMAHNHHKLDSRIIAEYRIKRISTGDSALVQIRYGYKSMGASSNFQMIPCIWKRIEITRSTGKKQRSESAFTGKNIRIALDTASKDVTGTDKDISVEIIQAIDLHNVTY